LIEGGGEDVQRGTVTDSRRFLKEKNSSFQEVKEFAFPKRKQYPPEKNGEKF